MIVRKAAPEECLSVAGQLDYVPTVDVRGIVAVDASGTVAGGILYDGWTLNAVHMHMWIPNPLLAARALLVPAFAYAFEEAGRGLALGLTPGDRKAACRLAKHLGFVELYRIEDGWAEGVPLIAFGMRREACRYLGKRVA